jgi:gas vesicle protein
MADNNNSIGPGTIMVAFVVGALTGAAVALLFAPASGEETREYLGEKARETKARALLGVIAVAVAVMAIVQVGAIVAGMRVARRVEALATDMETSVKPLLANLTTMSAEASRAAKVAAAQVERIDKVFGEMAARVDQTLAAAQVFISGPAKEGMAIVAGIRAAMSAVRGLREASRRRSAPRAVVHDEDEESLFIG